MNLKVEDNKESVEEKQVAKNKECKQQRKRNFTKVIESFNRLSKSK